MLADIEPTGHYVMVKPKPVETTSAGGVILSTGAVVKREQHAQVLGTLVGIGPNAWVGFDGGDPWAVVGEEVLYAKHGGKHYNDPVTDEEYIFLVDSDIVGKLKIANGNSTEKK